MHRRSFVKWGALAGMTFAQQRLSFAAAPTQKRLVVVLLRGGMDALHAVVPYADPSYEELRQRLYLPPPGEPEGVLDLDGFFGLHPDLGSLHKFYRQGDLAVVPAASTHYRKRSHFDGQNLLENGASVPFGAKDGWLNRALAQLYDEDSRTGLALGPTVPLILQGERPVRTWSSSQLPRPDEDFLRRVAYTYRSDDAFSKALKTAIRSEGDGPTMAPAPKRNEMFESASKVAASLLSKDNGPRIAVIESSGWDTHFAQRRRLKTLFSQLERGMDSLKGGLGPSWSKTAVVIVSEFGRTAAENGSGGTDHGVGGVAFLLGGAVKGGRVVGDWPGLGRRDLHEGRDLRPVTDYASIFKSVLSDHLGLDRFDVANNVFPQLNHAKPIAGLFA